MKLFVVLTLVFASLVFAQTPSPSPPASTKHPFTFEDMMKLKRLDEPVPSPDGRQRIRLSAPQDQLRFFRLFHARTLPGRADSEKP